MNTALGMRKHAVGMVAVILLCWGAIGAFGQGSPNVKALRDELLARYDIVALRDGLALVPSRPKGDIRLIEVRNGGVAINGTAVSASELRQRLGQDSDAILRVTYLDPAELQELSGSNSAPFPTSGNGNEHEAAAREHRGDRVHIGGGVTVGRGEIVQGDAVAIGGSADVDGEVTGDVTAIGGTVTLGPDANVRGDAVAIGGTVNRAPGARVDGQVTDLAMGLPFTGMLGRGFPVRRQFSRVGGLLVTLMRVMLLILCALIVVVLGSRWVDHIADRAAAEPARAGLAGLLAEILFVPLVVITIVVLAVSIIGIPLLLLVPFAVVLAGVLMFIGFTGVACEVGRLLSERFGIRRGPYTTVALGVIGIVAMTLLAKIIALGGGLIFGALIAGPLSAIGYLVEYLAWTIGIGALILAWRHSRRSQPLAAATTSGGQARTPQAETGGGA